MTENGDSRASLSHEERTKEAPRDPKLHAVTIARVEQANQNVRIIKLHSVLPRVTVMEFLAGQWLDVFCPGIPKAGGFTITSTPAAARLLNLGYRAAGQLYLELAIQRSPRNPPAAWLWRPVEEILDSKLLVRVGGSFVWPPPLVPPAHRKRVLLVGGGVGINPLISILAELAEPHAVGVGCVKLLYGTKAVEPDYSDVLFFRRISDILFQARELRHNISATLYVTSNGMGPEHHSAVKPASTGPTIMYRRMTKDDIDLALGDDLHDRGATVIYICGPQAMTDELVTAAKSLVGVRSENVLCEKWW